MCAYVCVCYITWDRMLIYVHQREDIQEVINYASVYESIKKTLIFNLIKGHKKHCWLCHCASLV